MRASPLSKLPVPFGVMAAYSLLCVKWNGKHKLPMAQQIIGGVTKAVFDLVGMLRIDLLLLPGGAADFKSQGNPVCFC